MTNQTSPDNCVKVLIVEDDPVFAEYLICLLNDMDFSSELCISAEKALEKLSQNNHYHIILLDVVLPNMSGIELIKHLKDNADLKDIPIIFLSQLNDNDKIMQAFALGAFDYITKPINPEQFCAKLFALSRCFIEQHQIKKDVSKYQYLFSKLQSAILTCNDGLIEVNQQLEIVFVNPAAIKMLDLPVIGSQGQKIQSLTCYEELRTIDWQEILTACKKGDVSLKKRFHFWHSSVDGQKFLLSFQVLITEQSKKSFYLQLSDITPLKTESSYFYNQDNIDTITGLVNHHYFTKHCQQVFSQTTKNSESMALIVINIARFSSMNDRYGHDVGDRILKRFGVRLKSVLNANDVISRFGNDEFTILFEDFNHWGVGKQIAKISTLFEKPLFIDENLHLLIDINIGIALSPQCGDNFSLLYQSAKIALENVKTDPNRSFCYYNDEIDQVSRFYLRIVELFDSAIENDEFLMNYQPQYDLTTGELVGVESLIRWDSPEQGVIPPSVFIPIAEESNHIVAIGDWVIKHVLADINSLKAILPNEIHIAINLSTKQLLASNLPNLIKLLHESLKKHDLSSELIELEITEHCLLSNPEDVFQHLQELRGNGFSISLDDFGTGYSSLTYVQRLPIDRIKIDLSFVKMIEKDKKTREIIRLIVELSKSLGLITIAEGIETEEQLQFLQKIGCNIGQGYLLSKPLLLKTLKTQLTVIPAAFL